MTRKILPPVVRTYIWCLHVVKQFPLPSGGPAILDLAVQKRRNIFNGSCHGKKQGGQGEPTRSRLSQPKVNSVGQSDVA
jgi:hypothetical protein